MAESTIEWTDYTFNPWSGCSKVSEGCKNCYAEVNYSVKMRGVKWGPQGNRIVKAESGWREPLKWDREAKASGERRRVFCASLADVFEDWEGPMLNSDGLIGKVFQGGSWAWSDDKKTSDVERLMTMADVRSRLFWLIAATPNLDWLLLTKRPENFGRLFNVENGSPSNVWIGVSVENQKAANERIPLLLQTPVAVRFLSCEPLLSEVILHKYFAQCECGHGHGFTACPNYGGVAQTCHKCDCRQLKPKIGWVIAGGESGPGARPCRPEWVRSIVEQCKAANVPVFVKQMGGNVVTRNDMIEDCFNNGESGWPDPNVEYNINGFREEYQGADCRIRLVDKKGGDMAEWPEDLRVREFPR